MTRVVPVEELEKLRDTVASTWVAEELDSILASAIEVPSEGEFTSLTRLGNGHILQPERLGERVVLNPKVFLEILTGYNRNVDAPEGELVEAVRVFLEARERFYEAANARPYDAEIAAKTTVAMNDAADALAKYGGTE